MINAVVKLGLVAIFMFSAGFMLSEGLNSQDQPSFEEIEPEKPQIVDFSPVERPSPSNWLAEDQIVVYPDKVILTFDNPQWAKFTNTNSMDPVIDEDSHALQIVPNSKDQIHIGDIVSYESKYTDGIIIHRVVELGNDGEWFAITKGDNNTLADPGKIRFEQIKRITVAVIY